MPFDINDQADLTALKNEYDLDPEGVGYASAQGTDALLLLFNDAESNPQSADQVGVPFDEYPMYDVLDEINEAEYNALTGFDKIRADSIIQSACSNPDLTFAHVKKSFKKAFGTGSTTWTNVKDDRQRQASRAEALFGRDTQITRDDWFAARDNG